MRKIKSIKGAKSHIKTMVFIEGTEEVYVSSRGLVYYSKEVAINHSKGQDIFTVKLK